MGRMERLSAPKKAMAKVTAAQDFERAKLQRLADAVRDEEHWQQILDFDTRPEVQEELERLVGPMLRFRRCDNVNCETKGRGIWRPVLLVRGWPEGPTDRIEVLRKVCTDCREETDLSDLLTDEVWERAIDGFKRVGREWLPRRTLTTLTWDAVN